MCPHDSKQKNACVVIPVYTTDLAPTEWVALEQCVRILGNHPLILVKPEQLDIRSLLTRHPSLTSEDFTDDYFTSINGYNRMMLSDEFYARFSDYEFMLVHQLDAFVFSDQLLQWCARLWLHRRTLDSESWNSQSHDFNAGSHPPPDI